MPSFTTDFKHSMSTTPLISYICGSDEVPQYVWAEAHDKQRQTCVCTPVYFIRVVDLLLMQSRLTYYHRPFGPRPPHRRGPRPPPWGFPRAGPGPHPLPPPSRPVDRPIFDWTSYSVQEVFKQVTPTDDDNTREVVYLSMCLCMWYSSLLC